LNAKRPCLKIETSLTSFSSTGQNHPRVICRCSGIVIGWYCIPVQGRVVRNEYQKDKKWEQVGQRQC
jgi:hypothetical protein